MIRCNLYNLVKDKKTTLTKLAKDTGVTYQGLRKLARNETNGITYETLDAICKALHCQTNKVIEYVPDDTESEPSVLVLGTMGTDTVSVPAMVELYRQFVEDTKPSQRGRPPAPIEKIGLVDALKYIEWLSEKTDTDDEVSKAIKSLSAALKPDAT